MADDIDDNHDADEPPTIPAFLATMTDEQRKMFVARFNSARVTSVEPIGENGALVEYETTNKHPRIPAMVAPLNMTPAERTSFAAFDVCPYRRNNEGKVSR